MGRMKESKRESTAVTQWLGHFLEMGVEQPRVMSNIYSDLFCSVCRGCFSFMNGR